MIFVKIGLLKCDFFCEKWYFENAIFMKNGLLKCDFCEKCNFENENFVKNVNFPKNTILNVNFLKYVILNMWIFGWNVDFRPSVGSRLMVVKSITRNVLRSQDSPSKGLQHSFLFSLWSVTRLTKAYIFAMLKKVSRFWKR